MFLPAALALFAPAVLVAHAPPEADADLSPEIDALAEDFVALPGAPGLQVAVTRDGQLIHDKGYGLADVENNVPMTPDAILRIGSVTKQFTAALIVQLAEQGKLDLDEPIATYLPDYPDPAASTVTLRNLLNHTSGIPNVTDLDDFRDRMEEDQTREQMLERFQSLPLEFDPGTKFRYSNSGYLLLGYILEEVSGKTYAELIRGLVEPLGLGSIQADSAADIIPHRAEGYTIRDGALRNAPPISMTIPGGAGSLLASAADLARWADALAAGRVVPQSAYQQMTAPVQLGESRSAYGFGLTAGDFHGRPRISHGGGINGFAAHLVHYPDARVSIAVIANTNAASPAGVAERVAAAVLGIDIPELADLPIPQDLADTIAGSYEIPDIGRSIVFTAADSPEGLRLSAQLGGSPTVPLAYQGDRTFRAAWDDSLQITFEPGDPAPGLEFRQRGKQFRGLRAPADTPSPGDASTGAHTPPTPPAD